MEGAGDRLKLVVPAKAGTHNHQYSRYENRMSSISPQLKRHGVWVPAFAGTTLAAAAR
jgi:hypothetical protein